MQIAIDNAKRKYDIDLETEIARICDDLDVDSNGLPRFWEITKKDKMKCRTDEERTKRQRANREKIRGKIKDYLICPMNYLYRMDLNKYHDLTNTIPMEYFFINHIQDNDRRKSKKVEELIEKYSIELYKFHINHKGINSQWDDDDDVFLLRSDFESLVKDIQSVKISNNYLGLMSWLINRAFMITEQTRGAMSSKLSKNKSILMKVLYSVNPNSFLACFTEKV